MTPTRYPVLEFLFVAVFAELHFRDKNSEHQLGFSTRQIVGLDSAPDWLQYIACHSSRSL